MTLKDHFAFLLENSRFASADASSGFLYEEVYFRSDQLLLRIAEQLEINAPKTLLCFLIDPSNAQRWCMFERAVEQVSGRLDSSNKSREQMAHFVLEYIDPVISAITTGQISPLQDFSTLK